MNNKALIIVDVQNDFLPGGALGVTDGHRATPLLANLMDEVDVIVFTRDWHPADHSSFAEGTPEYKDGSWPPHCVQNTEGAHIDEWLLDEAMETSKPVLLVSKGADKDHEAYSGFDVRATVTRAWHVNGLNLIGSPLKLALDAFGVREVKIGGLALDYCVKATALDALYNGFRPTVYLGATRPVGYLTGVDAVIDILRYGVQVDSTRDIL